MASITSANASINLFISILPPVNLQGFATDDIFSTPPIRTKEHMMGVDGRLSAGKVFVPVEMTVTFQADSPSISWFDAWKAQEDAVEDTYFASGSVWLPALGRKWTLNNGILETYQAIPDARRLLQPRRFTLIWELVSPAAI